MKHIGVVPFPAPCLSCEAMFAPSLWRVLVVLGVALILTLPAQAQSQGSDFGGAQISDVSGAAVFSDQPVQFRDPVIRQNVQNVAQALAQSIAQSGQVSDASGASVSVPPALARLLTQQTDVNTQSAVLQAFLNEKLPQAEAAALTAALEELLAGALVDATQFQKAVLAFNAVVEAAPDAFLESPPAEFVAARTVLSAMIAAAKS